MCIKSLERNNLRGSDFYRKNQLIPIFDTAGLPGRNGAKGNQGFGYPGEQGPPGPRGKNWYMFLSVAAYFALRKSLQIYSNNLKLRLLSHPLLAMLFNVAVPQFPHL